MVRLRAVYIAVNNSSDAIPSLNVPADAIEATDRLIPEIDISYRFFKYFAAELVLTYPQKHTVYLNAGGNKTSLGNFSHLPPSLLAQYHPIPDFIVSPYIGAGLNVTFITSTDIAVPGVDKLDLSSPSVGFAGQLGADIKIVDHFYVNIDAKYVTIGADVKTHTNGQKVSSVTLNPWLLGLGVGYRF